MKTMLNLTRREALERRVAAIILRYTLRKSPLTRSQGADYGLS